MAAMILKDGDRILHPKIGSGTVTAVDGNKLTIHFDSGAKWRIADPFVMRWGDRYA
jgi:DNA helicase-2/ATP-dependent DNA helicase PcrA